MDYQVSLTCEELAEWHVRLKGLADAHHGQPIAQHLLAVSQEIHDKVPAEWWAVQPQPLDNRVRN
jgi:hypothetical protein